MESKIEGQECVGGEGFYCESKIEGQECVGGEGFYCESKIQGQECVGGEQDRGTGMCRGRAR